VVGVRYGITMTKIETAGMLVMKPQDFQPRRARVKAEPLRCASMDQTTLSPQAYQRLRDELEERSGPTRRQISDWIERAREMGDLKENGDYHAAKNEQGLNEARVRQLEAILKTAVLIEVAAADSVQPGTVVEFRMEGDDDSSVYLVGSIEERGTGYDVLSPGSPLGKALLGHKPGEVVTYEAPGGKFEIRIVEVLPPV
jgi:transcription elongation factor GreA